MSEYSQFIQVGRSVVVKSGSRIGEVGRVASWDSFMEMWEVDFGTDSAYKHTDQIEPMFTMDQVVGVKLQEQSEGADLVDKVKPFGLSADELAEYCRMFIVDCMARIKKPSNQDQYESGGYQKFEELELDELLEYLEEEIRDIPNYLTMLFIRVRRIRQALKVLDYVTEDSEDDEEMPHEPV